MPTIAEVRTKFPQYADIGDAELADALHAKFYADMPRQEFNAKMGLGTGAVHGAADAAIMGGLDTATFGLLDEAGSGIDYLLDKLPGRKGRDYGQILAANRADASAIQADHPVAYLGGQVAGGVAMGAGAAGAGLSLAANAARAGSGLGRLAIGAGVDGAIGGAAQGFGSGEGGGGRVAGALQGGAIGAGLGFATPLALAGGGAAVKAVSTPLLARIRPEEYAQRALDDTVRRSGQSVGDITRSLEDASADGQVAFNLADALGNAGQRQLSTVARTPNDRRQAVVEALIGRQMDQGRRVAGALTDASGTPMTASQYQGALENIRGAQASVNYGPVARDTSAIDVSPAVAEANRAISPLADQFAQARGAVPTDLAIRSPIEAGEASIRDPIREAVKTARSYLASDDLTVVNVEKAFRAKTNIDAMIATATEKGQGGQVQALVPIRDALDEALARTSRAYDGARNAYRVASERIDAIDTGRQMASPRTRIDDNLATFSAMPEDVQAPARVGYFDPKIARAESNAGSMTNAARPYMSESARRELPAFAAPDQADLLMRRLGREQTMFETNAAALGGSKTADNLADQLELSQYDPSILSAFRQGPIAAIMAVAARAIGEAKGTPPTVAAKLADVLMETRPDVVRDLLSQVPIRNASKDARRAAVVSALLGTVSAGAGRLGAP